MEWRTDVFRRSVELAPFFVLGSRVTYALGNILLALGGSINVSLTALWRVSRPTHAPIPEGTLCGDAHNL